MNRLAQSIAEVCAARLLDEKWLVAASLRVGYQWLDTVTRHNEPVVNVRVHTLQALAVELAGPAMAERGLSLASAAAGVVLVDQVLHALHQDGGGYLLSLPPTPGLCESVYRSLQALRLAGMRSDDLKPQGFDTWRRALSVFGGSGWERFYEISDRPSLHQPFYTLPKGPGEKGDYKARRRGRRPLRRGPDGAPGSPAGADRAAIPRASGRTSGRDQPHPTARQCRGA